jgi:hypothetical protein
MKLSYISQITINLKTIERSPTIVICNGQNHITLAMKNSYKTDNLKHP